MLVRILRQVGCQELDQITNTLDYQIKTQNLQSSACIRAIGSFIRNPKKKLNEDDLSNPISTYETDYAFIEDDIVKYRSQRIKHECFSVLHPWAYDLDKVDFKYIMNNDLIERVVSSLKTQTAQVFWLTFFNSQAAVSADDFFGALREVANLNKIPQFYDANLPQYQGISQQFNYMISLSEHGDTIALLLQQVVDAGQTLGYSALRDQIKTYNTQFEVTGIIEQLQLPAGLKVNPNPRFEAISSDQDLNALRLRELSSTENEIAVDLQRKVFDAVPDTSASHKLHLTFEAVDTDELKNLEITVDGTSGIFKIGEGEANHYQIPNDKKLWESQLMIICKDGGYYIRDLGVVHTSRIKVD